MSVALAAHWYRGDMMGGGWIWMWVPLGLMVLVAVTVVVAVLVARPPRPAAAHDHDSGRIRARDILMERYARGEIDAEEYDERSARLR